MWKNFFKHIFRDEKNRKRLYIISAILVIVLSVSAIFVVKQAISHKSTQAWTETVDNEKTDSDNKKTTEDSVKRSESSEDGESEKEEGKSEEGLWTKIVRVLTGNGNQSNGNSSNGSQKNPESAEYTVRFFTEGGSELPNRTVKDGTLINSMPTPFRQDYIFVSWYYDEERTKLASANDGIHSDVDLYAEYAAQEPLESVETVNFASATDVDSDFQITVVTDNTALDAEAVKAGIEASNLTDPKQTDIIDVSGGNGTFVITGKNPVTEDGSMEAETGFAEGCTYRIALRDERLSFQEQPETAREYNFTTAKEEVLNTSLKDDIIFIPAEDVSNITNGEEHVQSLHLALYQADSDGTLGPANLTKGEFDYTKGELGVGDIVSIYAGLRPDERTLDTPEEENGDLAYIEITARNGNRYSYKNAAPEDVIFEPDMLPIPMDADMDETADMITVENKYLDYSADVYANIDLDSQTTVDVGDFLMFYTGVFGKENGSDAAQLEKYAKVVSVEEKEGDITSIGFEETSWEEVQQAMDIYAKDTMSGDDMLEGVDTDALEAQIEQQALDSGFAEEAAQYLGSLALATENFTKLSENINLEDYKITLEDGTPISPEELQLMASGVSAECEMEKGYPKATISTHPTKLGEAGNTAAKDKGLSVKLEVQANITIGKTGSSNQLVITVTGVFEEEVGLDMGVSSKAVWKVWGIFPYIAEYRVTANVDVLNYTGVEVNAIMMTKSDDKSDNEALDKGVEIASQIKELIDSSKNDGEDDDSEEAKNNLVKRYKDMMDAESDWVRVVEQNIVNNEQHIPPPLPIIAVKTEINFVVKMDACISIGFDFEYQTGKRYTYTIDVFAGAVYNDTVSLLEERYEFDFYTMGRLAIKAGLEFEFKIGLFSTDLASVGFEAEAGAYSKLWGYFYYELRYAESTGRTQQYNGALLIDVGAYLEVGLKAQALKDTYSTELKLYDNEWSLWTVGRQDSILDFATAQEDMPKVKLKQHVRDTVLPDSVFSMDYLDLKDGKEKQAIYEDFFDSGKEESVTNRKNFDIRMTNDKFSYDPQTNTVTVNPEAGDKKLEGEMIITWIRYPLAFSSRPIQRTISLYWDNLRDGYVIVPYTNGGSYLNILNAKYETKVEQPADPEKMGYDFAGWYQDEALTETYAFPEKMPAVDTNIYAKWTARDDTPYTVEYYGENLRSGEYERMESEELAGTTDSLVTPAVKEYTGYQTPSAQEVKVKPDGSTVLRYYYPLEKHSVTFDPGEAGGEQVTYELKYGGKVIAPMMAAKGYTFTGWDQEVVSTMGTEDVTYTAQWSKNPDTEYRVEYYVQDIDGAYKLQHIYEGMGCTEDEISADSLRALPVEDGVTAEQKYTEENGIVFENLTVNGIAKETAVVEGNGKTVIKINYKREKYQATFAYGYEVDGTEKVVTQEVYYGNRIYKPERMQRTGYTFMGWSLDGETIVEPEEKMGAGNITYRAVWAAHTYTIRFDKNLASASGSMGNMVFTYDSEQKLAANAFTAGGYDFAGWTTQKSGAVAFADGASVTNLTSEQDGEVILYAVWQLKDYRIRYEGVEGLTNTNPDTYNVETETITLMNPVRMGYTFRGWYEKDDLTGGAVSQIPKGSTGDRVLYASWEANADTPYKVEHYQEAMDESFVIADTEELVGTTDAKITAKVKAYPGFTAPEEQQVTIAADGSTYVRYEYKRKECTLTLDVNGGIPLKETETTITGKYESEIQLPVPTREGYGFDGWYVDDEKFTGHTMPADDVTLKARWVAGQYSYTINYFQQNVDGSEEYTWKESVHGTEAMDSEVEAEVKEYPGFTAPEKPEKIEICADASKNVVNYYYKRNQYKLTWDLAGGTAEGYTEGEIYFETPIVAPVPVKRGYSYKWNLGVELKMPANDLEYKAEWAANTYQVSMDANGGTVEEGTLETRIVAFDSTYGELPKLVKEGYAFDGWYTEAGRRITDKTLVSATKDHVIYAHFTPITYTITYYGVENADHENPESYTIETGLFGLADAKKAGYTFNGWYTNEALEGEAVKAIPAKSTGDIQLYAKWSVNHYKVVLHSNDDKAGSKVQEFAYAEVSPLTANSFERDGYEFAGWASSPDGEAVYEDKACVGNLTEADGDEIHLYAVWKPKTYQIKYENMNGAENADDNPTEFTAGNHTFTLHEPKGRTGYTFEGWYLDSLFEKKVSGLVTLNSYHDWIFYAKWKANPYTVTFDSCLGDTVPTETQMMVYDEQANLTLVSEMRNFTKPGYTFAGWSLEKGGAVAYTDGQSVIGLVGEGNINLYAVWNLNVFTIQYDLGAGGISHGNPASYSIEDDDVKLEDPVAKDGYQFLGWFDGETKVTEIVKGTQRDYSLVAKWGCGGIFNLTYENAEKITLQDGSEGYKLTYKVTRTLPENTIATPNPQHVYYQTVNGTAYGSTVDIDIAGDKYHFKHAGGENVYLTFGQNDMEKTFTIEEWGPYTAEDIAAYAQIGGQNRYYQVELYKVVDTVGTCQGLLGDSVSCKRTMDVADGSEIRGRDIYNTVFTYQLTDGQRKITDDGYTKNPSFTMKSMNTILSEKGLSDFQKQYAAKTATGIGFRLRADEKEKDDGYTWVRFSVNGNVIYERKEDLPDKKWHQYAYPSGSDFCWIGLNDSIVIGLDASGKGSDDWYYGSSYVDSELRDRRAPQQVGVANLAFRQYKAGETMNITVIYDEVINEVSGLGLSDITGIPMTDVTYVAGTGTNALTFTVTLTEDFEVTPDVNNAIKNLKPVTGTVKDIIGNQ